MIDTQQETSERDDVILDERLIKQSVQHASAKNAASSERQPEHVGYVGSSLFLTLRLIKYEHLKQLVSHLLVKSQRLPSPFAKDAERICRGL